MDTAQFLARVVAPGNFVAVAFLSSGGGVGHRFFRYGSFDEAVKLMDWCRRKGMDCWYAVGSYKLASPNPKGYLIGKRTQENVQALKALWIDIDVKRDGDKKSPDKVYADIPTAVNWFKGFLQSTKLLPPNLWVHSGYGLHVYWVLEDPMTPADWQPYADALKAALVQHGATLDVGITADSARILRAPGTLNMKNPAKPAPVTSLDRYSRGDYPNQLVFQALQPYVGLMPKAVVNQSGSALNGGGPATVFAMRQNPSAITDAATSDLPNRKDYYFANIAERCEQVKMSLANNGNGDEYPLWYLGHLSLASFCVDGHDFIHEIGKGDPRYDPADTKAKFAQTERERTNKGIGAPTCAHYERARPGVCQTCPYYNKVSTPFSLGVEDGDGDLPDHYRRKGNTIEHAAPTKNGFEWTAAVPGNVYNAILDRVGDDRRITFTYERAGTASTVSILQSAVPTDAQVAMKVFGPQGVSGLYLGNAYKFGAFIVAWIEKLRDMRSERDEPTPAFGWAKRGTGYAGFSVGGVCYRPDGNIESAPGGDRELTGLYRPRGSLDAWTAAANFVVKDRPDLQVIVAAAFGAPLVEFTGHRGFVMSAWSRGSAVGKTSALTIGTTVWANPLVVFNLDDTPNSTIYRIGKMRAVPAYWDEIRLKNKDMEEQFTSMLFQLSQGKEKARLNADATLKSSGDWKTMLIVTGNRPLMDVVVEHRSDTDAGAVRIFEYLIDRPQMPLSTVAQKTIASAGDNAGKAGEVYAAWLAKNPDAANSMVAKMQDQLAADLNPMQPERYFIAGMACLIVGAAIANSLGLVAFDRKAMKDFLAAAFLELRSGRKKDLNVDRGSFDIEKVLADFVADYSADRLMTEEFLRPGPNQTIKVIWSPRKFQGRLAIHIGKKDNLMRIDKQLWRKWCYSHGYSPSDATATLERRWGAKEKRVVMGAGTDLVTGRIDVIEIPLVAPELMEYNYSYNRQGKR